MSFHSVLHRSFNLPEQSCNDAKQLHRTNKFEIVIGKTLM